MRSNPRGGGAFDDADVAAAYIHRPPYPAELYAFLAALPARRRRALDLGCGPGKLAHELATHFEQVDAVDPALAMLRIADPAASSGQASRQANITWIHGFAETAPLAASYDLVTAGASIHWMDHAVVFPRLASILSDTGFVAVLGGDHAHDVPWQAEWEDFLRRWLEILGDAYDPGGYEEAMSTFKAWMDIAGERTFGSEFSQRVEDFIECQHSRATWSRANLGPDLTARFDAELRAMLRPYAADGLLTYGTRAEVVWGRPRRASL